jgi:hypothetical protein
MSGKQVRPWIVISLLLPAAACVTADSAKEVRTYRMGEPVQLGNLIYTAYDTQWMTQLGDGPNVRIPRHRYFLVRLSIQNRGSADTMAPVFSLVDDSGETFGELINGDSVPQWLGYLRTIRPGTSAEGRVIFDAAPKHYKLRVADESEQRIALIDIPLSFDADTPDIPLPEDRKK